MIPEELLKGWKDTDEEVRSEVLRLIKMSREDSDMNDDDHPKNQEFGDAFALVVGILEEC